MAIDILQLYPLSEPLEAALEQRFRVHRWHQASDHQAFLAQHGGNIRAVVTGGHLGLPAQIGSGLPNLEIVAINGVGIDKVDIPDARRRGYRVTNTPGVLTDDVADLAVGLAISALRRLPRADRFVREGNWPRGDYPLTQRVSGRRCGIFGLGQIGLAVARRLEGFSMPIAYCSRTPLKTAYPHYNSVAELAGDVDLLILTASASASTHHIIDQQVLEALGPRGVLVNVARGSLVDQAALIACLQDGRLGGAGLDVFADEPDVAAELRALSNVVLTPHMASATGEARQSMADLILANLDAHFAGQPLVTPVV